MADLTTGTTITASASDGGWILASSDGADGRIRGDELELGDITLTLQRTGMRTEFVTGTGVPMLRFDRAGRKATTLTTSSARFRLARQRPRPLLQRWLVTRDVHGDALLSVSRTPLGIRVRLDDVDEVPAGERAALVLGALVEVLEVVPSAAAA